MAAFSGTGPAQATAAAYVPGGTQLAAIFSDVGMTVAAPNPFVLQNGAYAFYAASAYVVVGVQPSIYEFTETTEVHTFREYQGPQVFP